MTKDKKSTKESIGEVGLLEFAKTNYYDYGISVLEDRAIPDFRDGMNPVNRRALWAAHRIGLHSTAKIAKAALVVGETMGKHHPHGDSSIYKAVVGMTNTNSAVALIEGSGNWGSLSEPSAAAMRYTEMRLSKFSDQVLFNKFYMPVIELCPNYDGSLVEPIVLPALLPIVLLNGRFGIAPGATANIPIMEYSSVLETLSKIYKGSKLTDKLLYETLKFRSLYGGSEVKPKGEFVDFRKALFTSTKGRIKLKSKVVIDSSGKVITITKFAKSNMESMLTSLLNIADVKEARDDSTKHDLYGQLTIILKKKYDELSKTSLAAVKKVLYDQENYVLNFTTRYLNDQGADSAKVTPKSLTQFFTDWIKWRIELEKKASLYWIGEADKRIARLDLLMLAVTNMEIIIESLKKDLEQSELEQWLAKKLKISLEDSALIYDLKVRQLRKLEMKNLLNQKKEVLAERKELEARRKAPEVFMHKQLDTFAKLV